MDSEDKKDVNPEYSAPRLTLIQGQSRVVMPHRAPKLKLIVNPEWKLYQALVANDPRRVAAAIARGADANARDPDGRTPLFGATLGDPAIAEVLLDRGANVRVRDNVGQTPLHGAAAFGEEAHMRVLLERGAEIDARDAAGVTPLHCAAPSRPAPRDDVFGQPRRRRQHLRPQGTHTAHSRAPRAPRAIPGRRAAGAIRATAQGLHDPVCGRLALTSVRAPQHY